MKQIDTVKNTEWVPTEKDLENLVKVCEELPVPSADVYKLAFLLNGSNDERYVKGHVYKCLKNTESGAYYWSDLNVGRYSVGNCKNIRLMMFDDGSSCRVLMCWEDPDDIDIGSEHVYWQETRLVHQIGHMPIDSQDGTTLMINSVRNRYKDLGSYSTVIDNVGGRKHYFKLFPVSKDGAVTNDDQNGRLAGYNYGVTADLHPWVKEGDVYTYPKLYYKRSFDPQTGVYTYTACSTETGSTDFTWTTDHWEFTTGVVYYEYRNAFITWAGIQELIQNKEAEQYFPLGTLLTLPYHGDFGEMAYEVVDFDTVQTYDKSVKHTMTLESKYLNTWWDYQGGVVFDTNELPAVRTEDTAPGNFKIYFREISAQGGNLLKTYTHSTANDTSVVEIAKVIGANKSYAESIWDATGYVPSVQAIDGTKFALNFGTANLFECELPYTTNYRVTEDFLLMRSSMAARPRMLANASGNPVEVKPVWGVNRSPLTPAKFPNTIGITDDNCVQGLLDGAQTWSSATASQAISSGSTSDPSKISKPYHAAVGWGELFDFNNRFVVDSSSPDGKKGYYYKTVGGEYKFAGTFANATERTNWINTVATQDAIYIKSAAFNSSVGYYYRNGDGTTESPFVYFSLGKLTSANYNTYKTQYGSLFEKDSTTYGCVYPIEPLMNNRLLVPTGTTNLPRSNSLADWFRPVPCGGTAAIGSGDRVYDPFIKYFIPILDRRLIVKTTLNSGAFDATFSAVKFFFMQDVTEDLMELCLDLYTKGSDTKYMPTRGATPDATVFNLNAICADQLLMETIDDRYMPGRKYYGIEYKKVIGDGTKQFRAFDEDGNHIQYFKKTAVSEKATFTSRGKFTNATTWATGRTTYNGLFLPNNDGTGTYTEATAFLNAQTTYYSSSAREHKTVDVSANVGCGCYTENYLGSDGIMYVYERIPRGVGLVPTGTTVYEGIFKELVENEDYVIGDLIPNKSMTPYFCPKKAFVPATGDEPAGTVYWTPASKALCGLEHVKKNATSSELYWEIPDRPGVYTGHFVHATSSTASDDLYVEAHTPKANDGAAEMSANYCWSFDGGYTTAKVDYRGAVLDDKYLLPTAAANDTTYRTPYASYRKMDVYTGVIDVIDDVEYNYLYNKTANMERVAFGNHVWAQSNLRMYFNGPMDEATEYLKAADIDGVFKVSTTYYTLRGGKFQPIYPAGFKHARRSTNPTDMRLTGGFVYDTAPAAADTTTYVIGESIADWESRFGTVYLRCYEGLPIGAKLEVNSPSKYDTFGRSPIQQYYFSDAQGIWLPKFDEADLWWGKNGGGCRSINNGLIYDRLASMYKSGAVLDNGNIRPPSYKIDTTDNTTRYGTWNNIGTATKYGIKPNICQPRQSFLHGFLDCKYKKTSDATPVEGKTYYFRNPYGEYERLTASDDYVTKPYYFGLYELNPGYQDDIKSAAEFLNAIQPVVNRNGCYGTNAVGGNWNSTSAHDFYSREAGDDVTVSASRQKALFEGGTTCIDKVWLMATCQIAGGDDANNTILESAMRRNGDLDAISKYNASNVYALKKWRKCANGDAGEFVSKENPSLNDTRVKYLLTLGGHGASGYADSTTSPAYWWLRSAGGLRQKYMTKLAEADDNGSIFSDSNDSHQEQHANNNLNRLGLSPLITLG